MKHTVSKYLQTIHSTQASEEPTQNLIKALYTLTKSDRAEPSTSHLSHSSHLSVEEIMQVVNFGPKSEAEVHLLLDNCEERFTQNTVQRIVSLVNQYLPT